MGMGCRFTEVAGRQDVRYILERLRALVLVVAVQLNIVTESPGDQIGRDY